MTRRDFIRRNGLAAVGIAVSASGCMGLFEGRRTVVRFGCVSDSHFGDLPDRGWNHFRESERKMSEAVSEFNRLGVDFAIELGDLIDSGEHDKLRVKRSLARIESVFSSCRCARYHVMGNHDFGFLTETEFLAGVGGRQWYSFERAGIAFVVLDGCFDSQGKHYAEGRFNWKDAALPAEQLQWLEQTLRKTTGPAVVFCHFPLVGADEHHRLRNASEVVRAIESSGKVKSVFCGHYHLGGYHVQNGCTYRILRAQVSKWANAAVVSVYEDGACDMEYVGG